MTGGRAHLLLPLLLLAALAAALALAGPGGGPAAEPAAATAARPKPAQADALDAAELTRISIASTPRVAREVERVRQLEFDHLPKPEVVTSAFLNRLGLREIQDQPGGLGLGPDDAVGRITGQLAPDEDLASIYRSTGDLAAAAYDPKSKRLYIVSDAVVANRALVEFVLAHELDHALEDQNFGLGDTAKVNDDGALARQALDEGSATDVMTEFASRYLNPLQLIASAQTIDDGTGNVPKAYVQQLTWTYLGGMKFIAALRDLAGSWKLVDYALKDRPPATTEQILHPRKYIRDERPSPVQIQSGPLPTAGWRPADAGVFGELATSYLLRIGLDAPTSSRAAAGWDGDRYELWRHGASPANCADPCRSDLVLVAKWNWDTSRDRGEFARAVAGYVGHGLSGKPDGDGVWRVRDGWVARAVAGDSVTLVFAPTKGLATDVAAAQN